LASPILPDHGTFFADGQRLKGVSGRWFQAKTPPSCRRPVLAPSGRRRQIPYLTRPRTEKGSYYTAFRSSRQRWLHRAIVSGPGVKQGG
jgi:hypothetical protein